MLVIVLLRTPHGRSHPVSATTVSLTFGAILFVGIVVSRWVTTFDLESRTLAVTFGPLLLGFAGLAGKSVVEQRTRGLRHLIAAALAGWVALVVALGVAALIQFESTGGASRTGRVYRPPLTNSAILPSNEGWRSVGPTQLIRSWPGSLDWSCRPSDRAQIRLLRSVSLRHRTYGRTRWGLPSSIWGVRRPSSATDK